MLHNHRWKLPSEPAPCWAAPFPVFLRASSFQSHTWEGHLFLNQPFKSSWVDILGTWNHLPGSLITPLKALLPLLKKAFPKTGNSWSEVCYHHNVYSVNDIHDLCCKWVSCSALISMFAGFNYMGPYHDYVIAVHWHQHPPASHEVILNQCSEVIVTLFIDHWQSAWFC